MCELFYLCYHLDYGQLTYSSVQCFPYIELFVAARQSQYQNWPPQIDFPKGLAYTSLNKLRALHI